MNAKERRRAPKAERGGDDHRPIVSVLRALGLYVLLPYLLACLVYWIANPLLEHALPPLGVVCKTDGEPGHGAATAEARGLLERQTPRLLLPYFGAAHVAPTVKSVAQACGFTAPKSSASNQEKESHEAAMQALSARLKDYGSDTAFVLRRILNGEIQFATFWIFWLGMVSFLTLRRRARLQERLDLSAVVDQAQPAGDLGILQLGKQVARTFANNLNTFAEKNRGNDPWGLQTAILTSIKLGNETGMVRDVLDEFRSQIDDIAGELDARHNIIRYSNWAIPSIGFLGTVWGIGASLASAHEVMESSGYEQVSAVQSLTGTLSVAFDTTMVALVLSIVLVACERVLGRKEHLVLSKAHDDLSPWRERLKHAPHDLDDAFERLREVIRKGLEGETERFTQKLGQLETKLSKAKVEIDTKLSKAQEDIATTLSDAYEEIRKF